MPCLFLDKKKCPSSGLVVYTISKWDWDWLKDYFKTTKTFDKLGIWSLHVNLQILGKSVSGYAAMSLDLFCHLILSNVLQKNQF